MTFALFNYNSQTASILKEELSKRKIEHIEKRFTSAEGIRGITTNHFVRLIYLCEYILVHVDLKMYNSTFF